MERRVHWDYRWAGPGLETVLSRLYGASMAQICFEGEESNQVNNNRFKTLMLDYEDWYQQGQQQQRSSDPLLYRKQLFNAPLTKLEATFCNVPMNVRTNFPFPSSLTNLTLEMGSSQTNTFDPSLILKQCPLLEDLLIARWEGWYVDGPWVPHDHNHQQLFRLKGIALIYPAFRQSDLEDLLLLTPHLRELKLAGVMDDQLLEVTKPCGRIQYDRKGFCQFLTTLPLKLESFLFSFLPRSLQNDVGTENVVTELCPTLHEWCLWTPDTTPALLKCLESLPNVITNLELCWNYLEEAGTHPFTQDYEIQVPRLLHQYLCNSPNLLCLKSLQAAYPIRVCRKDVDSPLYQPVLFKRLDGGLCFMTRLKKLQFLKVCTEAWVADFECKDVDLNWLLPDGRDLQEKMRRKHEMDGWQDWLDEERQLELERLAFGAGEAPFLKSADPSIPSVTKIYDQLKDLGLISEVKAMVDEMDREDGPEYLTEFKELSFGLQLGQRPDTTMNRVFPDRRQR
ncbi:hypothetical protein BGX24_003419 [Mortierella sp. AD032]|nr:hypothetical protein BGX24_003419 [Mortierella sp. AD032]